jgi:hypothetical protein
MPSRTTKQTRLDCRDARSTSGVGQQETHAAQQIRRPKNKKAASAAASRNLIRFFNQAAIAAAFFRFLRQPSAANAPSPPANSGNAAGSGV